MRIAMIGARGIPHTYSGNEEFFRNIAPRLVARGHEVIVYCRSGHFTDRSPTWHGVRRVFYPAPEHKSGGQFIHALLAAIDASVRRPDIVYIHTLPSAPHSIIPWITGNRVVVNVDGMDWARDKWGRIGKGYLRTAARIALRTASGVITDAEAMRDYYRTHFGRDVYCIPYGADIEASTHPEILAQYGLTPGDYYLIASRLVPENNPDLIVEAFTRTDSKRKLVVAGGANFSSPWVERLHATSDARVVFLGHVGNREHIKELHCNSYAYVHGHSLGGTNPSLLKALGYGNCILALDTPFNHEVLTGKTGIAYGRFFSRSVSAASDALAEIDRDPAAAAHYRLIAPDRIREAYSHDFITGEYERVFTEILRGVREPAPAAIGASGPAPRPTPTAPV
jgi:glycosyltransferase involved in cell wall biosynthesis